MRFRAKAVGEPTASPRSGTTTKIDSSSSSQRTSVTKAKLFKQVYPLPLTTTVKSTTNRTSDTSFKQVVQQIIAHIVNSSRIDDFLKSNISDILDDPSISTDQLDYPVFRSQFHAPIFEYFSTLVASYDSVETGTTTTKPSMESDLPFSSGRVEESTSVSPQYSGESVINSGLVSSGTIDIEERPSQFAVAPIWPQNVSSHTSVSPNGSIIEVMKVTERMGLNTASNPQDPAFVLLLNAEQENAISVTKPTFDSQAQKIENSTPSFLFSSRIEELIRVALEKLSLNTTQPSRFTISGVAPKPEARQPKLHIGSASSSTEGLGHNPKGLSASAKVASSSQSETATTSSALPMRSSTLTIQELQRKSSRNPSSSNKSTKIPPSAETTTTVVMRTEALPSNVEEHSDNTSQTSNNVTNVTESAPSAPIAASTILSNTTSAAPTSKGSGARRNSTSRDPVKNFPSFLAKAAVVKPRKKNSPDVEKVEKTTSNSSIGGSHFESSISTTTPPSTLNVEFVTTEFQSTFRTPPTSSSSSGNSSVDLQSTVSAILRRMLQRVATMEEQLGDIPSSSDLLLNSSLLDRAGATAGLARSTTVTTPVKQLADFSQNTSVLKNSSENSEIQSPMTTKVTLMRKVTHIEKNFDNTSQNETGSTVSMYTSQSEPSSVVTVPSTTASLGDVEKGLGSTSQNSVGPIIPTNDSQIENAFVTAVTVPSSGMALIVCTEQSSTSAENVTDSGTWAENVDISTSTTMAINSIADFRNVTATVPPGTGEHNRKRAEKNPEPRLIVNINAITEDGDVTRDIKNNIAEPILHRKPGESLTLEERGSSLFSRFSSRSKIPEEPILKTLAEPTSLKNVSSNKNKSRASLTAVTPPTHRKAPDGKMSVVHSITNATAKKNNDRAEAGKTMELPSRSAHRATKSTITAGESSSLKGKKNVKPFSKAHSRSSKSMRGIMAEMVNTVLEVHTSGPTTNVSSLELLQNDSPNRSAQEIVRNKNVGITGTSSNAIRRRKNVVAQKNHRTPQFILRRNSLLIPIIKPHKFQALTGPEFLEKNQRSAKVVRKNLNVLSVSAARTLPKEVGRQKKLVGVKAGEVRSHRKLPIIAKGATSRVHNDADKHLFTKNSDADFDQELGDAEVSGRVAKLLRLIAASVEPMNIDQLIESIESQSVARRQSKQNRSANLSLPVNLDSGVSPLSPLKHDMELKAELSTSHKESFPLKVGTHLVARQPVLSAQKVQITPRLLNVRALNARKSNRSIKQEPSVKRKQSPQSKSRAAPTHYSPKAIPSSSTLLRISPSSPSKEPTVLRKVLHRAEASLSPMPSLHSKRSVFHAVFHKNSS
ncbi:hypothetical protein COOONC_03927 [Cooperia oncophora]